MIERWSVEQVESVAPSPAAASAARAIASPQQWAATGADAQAVWGSFRGTAAEPYSTAVDHAAVGFRCTCASRRRPCKHAIALLLLWSHGQVPDRPAPPPVEAWIASRSVANDAGAPSDPLTGAESTDSTHAETGTAETGAAESGAAESGAAESGGGVDDDPPPPDRDERDAARDDRVERRMAGLTE
ncbi:MAG: hypothetical protein QNM02_00200, partial [Acidimicrobiia bacterium]|nr:hypothetical protein [Acidimicrobiia bacterium]